MEFYTVNWGITHMSAFRMLIISVQNCNIFLKRAFEYKEIMPKNTCIFPNFMKTLNAVNKFTEPKAQETWRKLHYNNQIALPNVQRKILKPEIRDITYKETKIRITDFLSEIRHITEDCKTTLKMLKENRKPKILYPVELFPTHSEGSVIWS